MKSTIDASGLELKQVTRDLGLFVLEANFAVASGERAAIVGPSGSGKTTLLRMIAGLDPVDQGEIHLAGQEISRLPAEKREIGFVFQEPVLFPSLNVLENADFGLRMRGVPREEREARVLPWLERVDLKSRAHSSVERLSGGERQRVAFVRALVWKPKLLLLDEPLSALDSHLRGALQRELLALHQLWPVPMLLVTHDSAEVETLATSRVEYRSEQGGQRRKFMKTPAVQRESTP